MCDTIVAMNSHTADGSVIFAKNSDREANEGQQLEHHPGQNFAPESKVSCTYISIPQVSKTNAVLLSRPFWMWGAEMGANEHGVVIGNEAVFTKLLVKQEGVLTGMDLVRLALERADSATAAKDVIIEFLGKYGQGGRAGYMDQSFTYHNSFIIADHISAWVLETAGEFWVTKKVHDYYAISNGLTIEDDYDEIHPEAEAFARKKGWSKKKFGFASAFSDWLFTRFSDCKLRRTQSDTFLGKVGSITPEFAFAHLRSHRQEPYDPAGHFLSNSICAHAGNSLTRHSSQTTGSLVAHLTDNPTYWVTASSTPCLSTFKPVWFGLQVVPDLGPMLTGKFEKAAYWWQFEELHRAVLEDYHNRADQVKEQQKKLESELLDRVYTKKENGFSIADESFQKSKVIIERLLEEVKEVPKFRRSNMLYRNYWKKQNRVIRVG